MCSVIRWSHNGIAEVVSRNMDWLEDMKSNLWVFPRGMLRDGLAGENSLRWKSMYGSVITSAYDLGTVDGMNEKGFAAHELWLADSDYGRRDEKIPGLSISLWPQYFLDNFVTVREALEDLQENPFQLVTVIAGTSGRAAKAHLMIEDLTGDAAVIEYKEGKPKIYHDSKYMIMTNDPTFDLQLENLSEYQGFGGDKSLPGTTDPADRFVRAAYYQKSLPKPSNIRETIAGVISVARNVSQPFGTPDSSRPYISATRWRTVSDLTNSVYYFESTTSPNLIWALLRELDFTEGAPVKKLDIVDQPDRLGNVSDEFKEATPFEFARQLDVI